MNVFIWWDWLFKIWLLWDNYFKSYYEVSHRQRRNKKNRERCILINAHFTFRIQSLSVFPNVSWNAHSNQQNSWRKWRIPLYKELLQSKDCSHNLCLKYLETWCGFYWKKSSFPRKVLQLRYALYNIFYLICLTFSKVMYAMK